MFDILNLDSATHMLYSAVVEHQPISMQELSKASGLTGPALLSATQQLRERGLISHSAESPSRLVASPPEIALEALLLEKEEQLKRAQEWAHHLHQEYQQSTKSADPIHLVEVVTGKDAVFERFQQLQRTCRQQIRLVDKPPYVTPNPELNLATERDLLNRGVSWRVIYDCGGLSSAYHKLEGDVASSITSGENARVMPNTPLKMMIADERMGMIPLQAAPNRIDSIVVVYRSALLEAMSLLFEHLWDTAIPLSFNNNGMPDSGKQPTDTERHMLGLLTAGLTDERIAEHMEISLRTMQRRLHELLIRLGANTRFQAGIQATRLGWISGIQQEHKQEEGE